jgi:hypothetical protein
MACRATHSTSLVKVRGYHLDCMPTVDIQEGPCPQCSLPALQWETTTKYGIDCPQCAYLVVETKSSLQ